MNVINDPATPTPITPTNVLIVGVGGQGVIMVSKVLARLCQVKGFQVKQSEVHGMAKRGGGVFSHVRFGKQVWSPTIPAGEADILVALEWAEGLRWLNHLKRDRGTFIADTQQIVPPIACRNRKPGAPKAYSPETPAEIIEMVGNGFALDATRMAADLGNARAANTILLGALSTALAFTVEDWLEVLDEFRTQSGRLVMAVVSQPGYHLTDLTPTEVVAKTLQFFKFKPMDERHLVWPNLPSPFGRLSGVRIVTHPARIGEPFLGRYSSMTMLGRMDHFIDGDFGWIITGACQIIS